MSLEHHSRKRKSQDDTSGAAAITMKKRKKQPRDEDGDLDVEAGVNRVFARMDSQLIADHVAQKTARFGSDLSAVELADLYISGMLSVCSVVLKLIRGEAGHNWARC